MKAGERNATSYYEKATILTTGRPFPRDKVEHIPSSSRTDTLQIVAILILPTDWICSCYMVFLECYVEKIYFHYLISITVVFEKLE